ncbi:MAG: hypothetical protein JRN69_06260 [Nitrososphaerota archaeon]|nr:hypothetical protein [Nitrososphaerota archaeon]
MPEPAEPLWVKNGPAFPYDVCFDFPNSRVLVLRAGSLSYRGGFLGSLARGGRGALKEQYDLIEALTIEERLSGDKESVLIPFKNILSVTLAKPWGRPPVLRLETDLTGRTDLAPNGSPYVRKHEFILAGKRSLRDEQIRQIKEALPRSELGRRFEDKVG